jgi:hypothetical protein
MIVCNVCLASKDPEESVIWDMATDWAWLGLEKMTWCFIARTVETTIGIHTHRVEVPGHLCDTCQRTLLNGGLKALRRRKVGAK